MLSIQTKYHGPTDTRGSRLSASTREGHKVTIGYPGELSGVDCHIAAVLAFLKKYQDFPKEWVYGASTASGYVFVAVLKHNTVRG